MRQAALSVDLKSAVFLFVGAWLTFRFTSDWPRGLLASGTSGVPAWALSLSYIGLCLWIVAAVPFTLWAGRVRERFRSDPIVQAHLLFLGYQLVALALSVANFGASGAAAGTYILLVCMSFLVLYLLAVRLGESTSIGDLDASLERSTRLVSWVLMPTLLIGFVQLVTGGGKDVGDGIPRIFGGTSSPNVLGSLLLVAGAPVFAMIMAGSRGAWKWRSILGIFGVLFVACFSITGFMCLAATGVIYWFLHAVSAGRVPVRLRWVMWGLVVATIVGVIAGEVLAARFASLGESENSLVWRLRTWSDVLSVLRDPQILAFGGGLGFDHLGIEYGPHNEYLRVLLETGVLGLGLFALIWARVYIALGVSASTWHPRLRIYARALQAACAGLLIWAFADSVLRTAPSAILLWLLVGITVGAARSRITIPYEHTPR